MNLDHGGHLTHGSPVNFSGKLYQASSRTACAATPSRSTTTRCAGSRSSTGRSMIQCGTTAYSRMLDFAGVPLDRRRGRRAAVRRHRAHRGARGRGGHPPEPDRPGAHRHDHHAQDAARPARRHDPVRQPSPRQIDKRGVPGRAGRAADARDRGEGGGVPRGGAARLQGLLRGRSSPTRARSRRGVAARGFRVVSGGTDTTCSCSRSSSATPPARAPRRRSSARASPPTRTWCRATRASRRDVGPAHRHAGGHDARHARAGDGADRRRWIARALEQPGDVATLDRDPRRGRGALPALPALCRTAGDD